MHLELIKQIEFNIIKSDDNTKKSIRNDTIQIQKKNSLHNYKTNEIDCILKEGMNATKKFITQNPEILITRADKGNSTVVINTNDYKKSMHNLLADNKTYIMIKKDLTKMMTNQVHKLLMRWKSMEFIDQCTYRKLNVTDGTVPRTYELPKIHKNGYPLRIIISCINSPLYPLAAFIKDTIKKSLKKGFSFIRNSFELSKKLNGLPLNNEHKILSFDIVSMYTNIPEELVIRSIDSRWNYYF
ncbi:hypothetical protein ALC57_04050 [Trachymyrmex cornetzi]|uniref:Reverse transcriptase domain-containing protein n=1 Tax=Trachymyrmex cornetzi TaxID=471704 RepID=A0A151JF49_9HYME|nr:hypothetical protein ALC57_04050 [Trachymyrmex cornetzi]